MTREFDGCSRLNKCFEENGIFAEVYQYGELPVVCAEITWGDWKHDHLRADWLAEENGFAKMKVEVTEEDGSDTYSATHYYIAR